MDLGTKEHTSLSVCHCLGRRLGEGAVQAEAAAVPLRRQGEGGAAGGQGPTACRLPPGACRCQGEGGPEAEPRSRGGAWPPAPCAWRLRPDRRAEGGLCRRPSRWRVAAGGWGLGRIRGCAWWRTGVRERRRRGWGEPAKGRGARSGRNLLLDVGLGQFEKVEKKNFGPNPGPWPGWPGV